MHRFTKLVAGVATGGLLLAGGQAMAADLYVAPAAVDNFSGFYGGVHGGWGFSDAKSAYAIDDPFNTQCGGGWGCAVDVDPDGGFIGFQAGYNFQLGNGFILGIEGDYSFASLHDDAVGTWGGGATEVILDVDRMASIRGRLGMDMGQWMPFITAGWGWMEGDRSAFGQNLCGISPNCKTEDSNWHSGFVVGGGLEYALTENWRLKAEYRYWDGSKETYGIGFGGGTDVDLSIHTVQFGVNYGF